MLRYGESALHLVHWERCPYPPNTTHICPCCLINYKFDESLSCNPLHQIEVLYNMRQLITSPTRVTLTTSTLIDVLFTNDHNSHVMTGVYDTALSDHYLIYTVFSKRFVRKERAHKEIKFSNYGNCSPEEFRKDLLENDSITNTD